KGRTGEQQGSVHLACFNDASVSPMALNLGANSEGVPLYSSLFKSSGALKVDPVVSVRALFQKQETELIDSIPNGNREDTSTYFMYGRLPLVGDHFDAKKE
ncbi:MAG: hypothetical protein O6826_04250, partial [Acidobacteria bacterium]|nr:hypothetical protein [Acidobacteriota bacterium]